MSQHKGRGERTRRLRRLGLGVLGLALAALLLTLLWPDGTAEPVMRHPGQRLDARAADSRPLPERLLAIFPALTVAVPAPQPDPDPRARIAIVLDDMGPDRAALARASGLPATVSFAFLPYAAGVEDLAAEARQAGRTVLLHMPMEPLGPADPGPGAMLSGQPPAEQLARLEAALARFRGLDGVNNHMGSRLTADRAAMERVMQRLRGSGLFFLDSRTTAETEAAAAASRAGIPNLSRDVFLDPDGTGEVAEAQLRRTLQIADETGQVVAIGHPHRLTLAALERFVATLDRKRYRLVTLSELVAVSAAR